MESASTMDVHLSSTNYHLKLTISESAMTSSAKVWLLLHHQAAKVEICLQNMTIEVDFNREKMVTL